MRISTRLRLPWSVALTLPLSAVLASCVVGAPPGFSPGDTWTFPLVDPLADGRLVVPVMVDGKGPFLFAVDPDAPRTTADRQLAAIAGVPAHQAGRVTDEHDTTHPIFTASLPNLKIGTLEISLLRFTLVNDDSFDADGRRIWGVLGRDVIADSLVVTVDRDRGVVRLTTVAKYVPPANAQVIPYKKLLNRTETPGGQLPGGTAQDVSVATPRFLVTANIDGKQADLHLDLGDAPSSLRPELWEAAHLQPAEQQMLLIDETGTRRVVDHDGIAAQVQVPTSGAPVAASGLGFVPFTDGRWISGQIDGTLGLDFFRPYVVSADWQHERFYLSPRDASPPVVAQRLARWGRDLTGLCKVPGCATASAVAGGAAPPSELGMAEGGAAPPAVAASAKASFHIQRDPAMGGQNLEIVMAAVSTSGERLPDVYVDLGRETLTLDAPIDPRYAGATFSVADLSPYPRACPNHAPSCAHLAPPVAP